MRRVVGRFSWLFTTSVTPRRTSASGVRFTRSSCCATYLLLPDFDGS